MSSKPSDPEIERAAAVVQLSIMIVETMEPREIGNDVYELLHNSWIRQGRSPEWINTAVDAIDDIKRLTFTKNAQQKWVLVVEWNEE